MVSHMSQARRALATTETRSMEVIDGAIGGVVDGADERYSPEPQRNGERTHLRQAIGARRLMTPTVAEVAPPGASGSESPLMAAAVLPRWTVRSGTSVVPRMPGIAAGMAIAATASIVCLWGSGGGSASRQASSPVAAAEEFRWGPRRWPWPGRDGVTATSQVERGTGNCCTTWTGTAEIKLDSSLWIKAMDGWLLDPQQRQSGNAGGQLGRQQLGRQFPAGQTQTTRPTSQQPRQIN